MPNLWRRLYAALTHTGPGYDLPGQSEVDLRATLTLLAYRWEQLAGPAADPSEGLFVDEVTPAESAQVERAHTYRTAAFDLRDVLRTGRIPYPIMTDAELEQHGTPEEAAS